MKLSTFLLVVFVLISCSSDKMNYPVTHMGNVTDTIFGTPVPDPYRWLEDDMSAETAGWVQAQNKVTFGYLGKIPYREQIKKRLTEMWNYEKYRIPFIEGEYTYFSKNNGLQNQYVYYRQKEGEEPVLFLDPNTFSEDGTTSLAEMGFSKDGNIVAYAISEGGSDWRKVIVMNANSKEIIGDTLKDIKFTAISWKGNEGFYYSSYDKPQGSELSAQTDHHKLYYHKLGTPQKEDKVVFGSDIKRRYIEGFVTDDDRYLVVTAAVSTTGNELYIKDLTRPDNEFKTIVGNFDNNHFVLHNEGSVLYISTNLNAPNTKVITVDAQDPAVKNWKDLIPETEYVLQPSAGSGYIFANYLKDAVSYVRQFDLKGQLVREIVLPGPGSAEGFSGKKSDKMIFYSFTNYITPAVMYKMDPTKGITDVYKKPAAMFNGENYVSEQVFYNSKDGTRIPMIITYKKNTRLDGKTPAMLYGYGGFGVSETPEFSVTTAVWMELGGIYAVPNLRGGGEYGEKWHLAGTRMNKQNVDRKSVV